MGRLRDDYESPLMRGVTEEYIDLFGVDDAYLFRFSAANNCAVKDPLWDEPTSTAAFKQFRIKLHVREIRTNTDSSSQGRDDSFNCTVTLSLNHLVQAQIPVDPAKEYVAEGDVVGFHWRGEYMEFDIIQVDREGWVADSDQFTGYTLDCQRRAKYVSERKSKDGPEDTTQG